MARPNLANFANPFGGMSDEQLSAIPATQPGGAAVPVGSYGHQAMQEYNKRTNEKRAASEKASKDKLDAQMAGDKARFESLTSGRGQQIMDDPRISAALGKLEQMQAQGGPYSDKVQQQIINRQADMTAGAEAANANAIRSGVSARGGSMDDPSARAAMAQSRTSRQQQNVANAGDVATRAALANFQSGSDLAGQIAQMRLGQYGMSASPFAQAANAVGQATYDTASKQIINPFQAPQIPQQQQGPAYQPPEVQQAPQYDFGEQPQAHPQAQPQGKPMPQGNSVTPSNYKLPNYTGAMPQKPDGVSNNNQPIPNYYNFSLTPPADNFSQAPFLSQSQKPQKKPGMGTGTIVLPNGTVEKY